MYRAIEYSDELLKEIDAWCDVGVDISLLAVGGTKYKAEAVPARFMSLAEAYEKEEITFNAGLVAVVSQFKEPKCKK